MYIEFLKSWKKIQKMSAVKENIEKIKDEIDSTQAKLIAVSKYVSLEKIVEAYDAGIRDFAESKAIDAIEKINQLPKDIRWHFIGHLQTNKVKKVTGRFELIHSVDSYKLASSISAFAKSLGITQKILLQLNLANEEQKSGFSKTEIKKTFGDILKLENIKVEGLMMMAPYTNDEDYLYGLFKELSELKKELSSKFSYEMKELSMGMSNDYAQAVKAGSTMIRIGSKLFNS